jgi:hypothetical protein
LLQSAQINVFSAPVPPVALHAQQVITPTVESAQNVQKPALLAVQQTSAQDVLQKVI